MVFSNNDRTLLKEIAEALKLEIPNCTYDDVIRLNLGSVTLRKISSSLLRRRKKSLTIIYPSVLHRTIQRNKAFLKAFFPDKKLSIENLGVLQVYDDSHDPSTVENTNGDEPHQGLSIEKPESYSVEYDMKYLTPIKMDVNGEENNYKIRSSTPNMAAETTYLCNLDISDISKESKDSRGKTVNSDNGTVLDVSREDFAIPKSLMNLSTSPENIILPKYSKNIQGSGISYKKSTFKECTIFEGSFVIPQNIWETIFKEGKLIVRYYPFFIKNRIFKKVNNVCQLVIKYVKYLKRSSIINIFAECIHNNHNCKKFKIEIKNKTVCVFSTSLDYYHKSKLATYVRGIERSAVKRKILNKKPLEYKKHSLLKINRLLANEGNLQDVKSDCTLRKIRSEAKSELDRDPNDILDLIKMQKDHGEYLKEISIPFNVKLYSLEQLKIFIKQIIDDLPPLIHFDATGSLIQDPLGYCKRIFLYACVFQVQKTKRTCPLFEMISSEHYSKVIFKILHDFRTFCEEQNRWPLFKGIVSDFSFANLHAISRAFNSVSLLDYLSICFKIVKCEMKKPSSLITIHLCCAHFMKMVSKDVNAKSKNNFQKTFFKEIIAAAIIITDFELLGNWFYNVVVLLSSKYYDKQVKEAHDNLLNICLINKDKIPDIQSKYSDLEECEENIFIQDSIKYESLYASSPFFQHFCSISAAVRLNTNSGPINEYENEDLLDLIKNKYMPYTPLWNGIMLTISGYSINRISNALVEGWFKQIKTDILKGEKNLKCSRFIRLIREHVLSINEEENLDIGKTRLTKQRKYSEDELLSQETWAKKTTPSNSFFLGKFLKKQKDDSPKDLVSKKGEKEENPNNGSVLKFDFTKCIYCGHGSFNQETNWVQCDMCDGWVHQLCDSPSLQKSYSGPFLCKLCNMKTHGLHVAPNQAASLFVDKCDLFFSGFHFNGKERLHLEENTREQKNCDLWKAERRTRLTASLFGRVVKARSPSSYKNIAESIINKNEITTSAMQHGLLYEKVAVELYTKLTGRACTAAGLFIHKDYPYLAGSPDGLIDDDGLIEVKCPYSVKDIHPDEVKLKYLQNDGMLKNTHEYYYQIQGLLEITDRNWCDFVVYTFKGIKIQRIERNEKLFKIILPKLKKFYLFYFIPKILFPSYQFPSEDERKWRTIQEIKLLPNFLVDDINYYKKLPSGRGYTVAGFQDLPYNINKIDDLIISDYATLDHSEYLSNFIIDILMNLLQDEKQPTCQIICCDYSTYIFRGKVSGEQIKFSEYFLGRINLDFDKKLAMPVNINQMHWCLAIADFENRQFTYIDPMNSSKKATEKNLQHFLNFLQQYQEFYKIDKEITNWNSTVEDHIIQQDNYNCGAYILYFFECIVNKRKLNIYRDMDNYRDNLKTLLLHRSRNMQRICPYCYRETNNVNSLQCKQCTRYIHQACLSISKINGLLNDMCELCHQY